MQQKLKVSLNNNTMLLRDTGNLTGWEKKSVEFPVRLNKRAIFSFPRYAAAWCVTDSQHEAETISCNQPRTSSLYIHYIYTGKKTSMLERRARDKRITYYLKH